MKRFLLLILLLLATSVQAAYTPTVYFKPLNDTTLYIKFDQYEYIAIISAGDTILYGPHGFDGVTRAKNGDTVYVYVDGGDSCKFYVDSTVSPPVWLQDCGDGLTYLDSAQVSGRLYFADDTTTYVSHAFLDSIRANLFSGVGSVDSFFVKMADTTVAGWVHGDDTIYVDTSSGAAAWDTSRTLLTDRPDTAVGPIVVTGEGLSQLDSLRLTKLLFGEAGTWAIDSALADSMVDQKGVYAAGVGSVDSAGLVGSSTLWNVNKAWKLIARTGLDIVSGDSAGVDTVAIKVDTANDIASLTRLGKLTDDSTALIAAKDSVAAWDNGAYPIPTTYATKANIHDSTTADTSVFLASLTRLGKITDDTTALIAAKDSVAAWDNRGYPVGSIIDTITTIDIPNAQRADTLGTGTTYALNIGDTVLQSTAKRFEVNPATGFPEISLLSAGDSMVTMKYGTTTKSFSIWSRAAVGQTVYFLIDSIGWVRVPELVAAQSVMSPSFESSPSLGVYAKIHGSNQVDFQDSVLFHYPIHLEDSALFDDYIKATGGASFGGKVVGTMFKGDSTTADSGYATINKAKTLIGDSLAAGTTNQQFIGDVWTYGISAEANKSFDLSLPYMYIPLPDTCAKLALPPHYMRKLAGDSITSRYKQVHPAVAHIPWGDAMGWTYHVLTTPYPTSAYENVCYYVSNDMSTFQMYVDTSGDSVHNPIYSGIADTLWADSTWGDGQSKLRQLVMKPNYIGWDTAGYLSDPAIMWDALGKKWIGFRASYIYGSNPDTFGLYVVHFDSMINKRPPTLVWKSPGTDNSGAFRSLDSLTGLAVSPSWWLDDTATVKMMFIEKDSLSAADADVINDWVIASNSDYDNGETDTMIVVNVDSVQVDSMHLHLVDSVMFTVTQGAQACSVKVDNDGVSASTIVSSLVAAINANLDSCRAVAYGGATAGSARYSVKAFNGSSNPTYASYEQTLGEWATHSGHHTNKKQWNDTAYFYDATTTWDNDVDTIHPTRSFWHASFKRVAPRQILGLGTNANGFSGGILQAVQSFDAGATWSYPTDTLLAAGKSKYLTVGGIYRSDFWIREGGRLGIMAGLGFGTDTTRIGVTYSQIVPFDTLVRVAKEATGPYLRDTTHTNRRLIWRPLWNLPTTNEPICYFDSATGTDATVFTDTTDWLIEAPDNLIWDTLIITFKTSSPANSAANNNIYQTLIFGPTTGAAVAAPTTLWYTIATDTANSNLTRWAIPLPADSIRSIAGAMWRVTVYDSITASSTNKAFIMGRPPQLIGHKRYWRDPNVPRR